MLALKKSLNQLSRSQLESKAKELELLIRSREATVGQIKRYDRIRDEIYLRSASPGKPLKEWLTDEAIKSSISNQAVYMRLQRGKYPGIKLNKVRHSVVFVEPA